MQRPRTTHDAIQIGQDLHTLKSMQSRAAPPSIRRLQERAGSRSRIGSPADAQSRLRRWRRNKGGCAPLKPPCAGRLRGASAPGRAQPPQTGPKRSHPVAISCPSRAHLVPQAQGTKITPSCVRRGLFNTARPRIEAPAPIICQSHLPSARERMRRVERRTGVGQM